MKAWFSQPDQNLWVQLEIRQITDHNIYHYLLTSQFLPHIDIKLSPTIRATTQAW